MTGPEGKPGFTEAEKIKKLREMVSIALANPDAYAKFTPFIEEMRRKYRNLEIEDYRLFWVLTMQDVHHGGKLNRFDLPGGEIESFVRSLLH